MMKNKREIEKFSESNSKNKQNYCNENDFFWKFLLPELFCVYYLVYPHISWWHFFFFKFSNWIHGVIWHRTASKPNRTQITNGRGGSGRIVKLQKKREEGKDNGDEMAVKEKIRKVVEGGGIEIERGEKDTKIKRKCA